MNTRNVAVGTGALRQIGGLTLMMTRLHGRFILGRDVGGSEVGREIFQTGNVERPHKHQT